MEKVPESNLPKSIEVRVLFTLSILILSASTVSGSALGGSATPTEVTCSPLQLASESAALDSALNWDKAEDAASASPYYQTTLAQFGPNLVESNVSVFATADIDWSTCALAPQSVNVAVQFARPGVNLELTVQEVPTSYSPENGSIEPFEVSAVSGGGGEWSGWTIGECSGCQISLTYSQVQNLQLGVPSGDCGAPITLVGVCEINFWTGLTATEGGGGTPTGIAQSGLTDYLTCTWIVFGYACVSVLEGWYQFYPQMQDAAICPGFPVSQSDTVYSQVYWLSPNQYTAQVIDDSTGKLCTGQTTMAMGTPNFAQFMRENSANGAGGYYDTPTFSMWFNPMDVLGDPPNVNGVAENPRWTGVSGVTVSSIVFDSSPCTSGSCYELQS